MTTILMKESVNQINIKHLRLACRHYYEMRKAGITKNWAIRTLELFVDNYARQYTGGKGRFNVLRAKDITLWSKKARKYKNGIIIGKLKAGNLVRVEHGTPRRSFAEWVINLDEKGKLNSRSVNHLVDTKWELAVITLQEDGRLNESSRIKPFDSPRKRWASVGIKF